MPTQLGSTALLQWVSRPQESGRFLVVLPRRPGRIVVVDVEPLLLVHDGHVPDSDVAGFPPSQVRLCWSLVKGDVGE